MIQKKQTKSNSSNRLPARLEDLQPYNLEDAFLGTINWHWRKFALNIMNNMPKYAAYADAFGIENVETDERAYMVAAACASRLLKNAKFRQFYRDLLDEQGFNHDIADTRLLQALTDPNIPWKDTLKAIEQYNKLNGRLITKIDNDPNKDRPIPTAMVEFIGPDPDSEGEHGNGSSDQSQG